MSCPFDPASEDVADFIVSYHQLPGRPDPFLPEGCTLRLTPNLSVVYVPLPEAEPMTVDRHSYNSIPNLYAPLDTSAAEASGLLSVFHQPALGNRGEGTMIGIVDTGIDWASPLFLNEDGTTRILGLWDQTLPHDGYGDGGSEPVPYYGRRFTAAEINEALSLPAPQRVFSVPSLDETGHGTALAAISAGNETADGSFTGAAPRCRLGIVRLKPAKQYLRDYYGIRADAEAYQENDIMAGILYLLHLASVHDLPLTLLIAMGTNLGSHEGTSPLASYLNMISQTAGIITVTAAGNETGCSHHYLGVIPESQSYEDVELKVAPGERGFTLELWAGQPDLYTVGFISPTGEYADRIPYTSRRTNRISFLLEETIINVNYLLAESGTGSQAIIMRFEAPAEGLWRIRVFNSFSIRGEYHMWLPVRGFVSDGTIFLRPNPDTTVTEPGNAPLPLTIAAYNHLNSSIYLHSSRGYTRLNTVKPDLAAPGVAVSFPQEPPDTRITGNGRSGGRPSSLTGTSAAAAVCAGAAANLLSWAVRDGNQRAMNTSIARAYLIRGAKRQPLFRYPNREWGYGQLDLYHSFLNLREQ